MKACFNLAKLANHPGFGNLTAAERKIACWAFCLACGGGCRNELEVKPDDQTRTTPADHAD